MLKIVYPPQKGVLHVMIAYNISYLSLWTWFILLGCLQNKIPLNNCYWSENVYHVFHFMGFFLLKCWWFYLKFSNTLLLTYHLCIDTQNILLVLSNTIAIFTSNPSHPFPPQNYPIMDKATIHIFCFWL